MVAQVGYSIAGRSRGRVTSCAVCTVHVETRSAGFLVELPNQNRRFVSDLTSKPLGRFVSGLASKPLGRFLISLRLKTDGDGLLVVWHQNHSNGFHWFDL
jgi:hypothetical protein